jgi:HEAT repeat protein
MKAFATYVLLCCGVAAAPPPAAGDAAGAAVAGLGAAGEPARLEAAGALRDLGAAEVGPHAAALVEALEREPSRLVREKIAWALGNAEVAAVPLLPRLITFYRREPDGDVKRTLLRTFAHARPSTPEVVELLVGELKEPILGKLAVSSLGALGSTARPAVPALVAVLGGDDSSSRISAAISLGSILEASPLSPGGADPLPAAVAALSRSLGDLHLTVRQESAQALGKIGPAAAASIPALIAVLELEDDDNSDSSVHRYAAWSIGQMGKLALPAVPALRRCYENDPDPFTRKAAAAALGKLGVAPTGKNLDT